MRDHRSRGAPKPSRVAKQLSSLLLLALGAASACATEVNTLENEDGTAAVGNDHPGAGTAGSPSGGKPTTGGTSSAGGKAGTGGKIGNAFGGASSTGGAAGTASSGGKAGSGGAAGGAGSGGKGGTSGTAGGAGSGGKGGTSGTAGSGGKGGTSGSAGSGGGGVECLKDWKSDPCNTCTMQTQSDKLACVDILDCFAANACGPTSCANNDDECGANKIAKGTAGYPIATEVYDCLCK
jgi:hypothetical protein